LQEAIDCLKQIVRERRCIEWVVGEIANGENEAFLSIE